jgi:hypothetical protein
MDLTKLSPSMVAKIFSMLEDYISGSRKEFAAKAAPLTDAQRAAMQPFFPAALLDSARVCVLRGSRLPNPSIYAMAKMMGISNLPDFSGMAAVTFVDVIVSHEEVTDSLLFHELVHAAQYAQLGLKEFVSRYVNGYLQAGNYQEVPLEKEAYQLEGRFMQDRGQAFSVADEVRRASEGG